MRPYIARIRAMGWTEGLSISAGAHDSRTWRGQQWNAHLATHSGLLDKSSDHTFSADSWVGLESQISEWLRTLGIERKP